MLSILLNKLIGCHRELSRSLALLSLLLHKLLLKWILAAANDSNRLLGRRWIWFIVSESVIYSRSSLLILVLIDHIVKVNGFAGHMLVHHILLTFRIVIYRSVLASLTDALSGLNNVCWISRWIRSLEVVLAVSIDWWKLLHVKLDVIHLKIPFWCLACCDKATSNSWSICYWLRESTDIWNSKLVHG